MTRAHTRSGIASDLTKLHWDKLKNIPLHTPPPLPPPESLALSTYMTGSYHKRKDESTSVLEWLFTSLRLLVLLFPSLLLYFVQFECPWLTISTSNNKEIETEKEKESETEKVSETERGRNRQVEHGWRQPCGVLRVCMHVRRVDKHTKSQHVWHAAERSDLKEDRTN